MTRASVISIDVPTQSHFFNQTALETLRPLMLSQLGFLAGGSNFSSSFCGRPRVNGTLFPSSCAPLLRAPLRLGFSTSYRLDVLLLSKKGPCQGGTSPPALSPVGRVGVHPSVVEHLGHGCTVRGDRLHPRPGSAGVGAAPTAAARLGPRGSGHRAGTVAPGLSPGPLHRWALATT